MSAIDVQYRKHISDTGWIELYPIGYGWEDIPILHNWYNVPILKEFEDANTK